MSDNLALIVVLGGISASTSQLAKSPIRAGEVWTNTEVKIGAELAKMPKALCSGCVRLVVVFCCKQKQIRCDRNLH